MLYQLVLILISGHNFRSIKYICLKELYSRHCTKGVKRIIASKTEVPRDVRNSKSPETRQVQE